MAKSSTCLMKDLIREYLVTVDNVASVDRNTICNQFKINADGELSDNSENIYGRISRDIAATQQRLRTAQQTQASVLNERAARLEQYEADVKAADKRLKKADKHEAALRAQIDSMRNKLAHEDRNYADTVAKNESLKQELRDEEKATEALNAEYALTTADKKKFQLLTQALGVELTPEEMEHPAASPSTTGVVDDSMDATSVSSPGTTVDTVSGMVTSADGRCARAFRVDHVDTRSSAAVAEHIWRIVARVRDADDDGDGATPHKAAKME